MLQLRHNDCDCVFLSFDSALDHLNKVWSDPIVLLPTLFFLCQTVKLVFFLATAVVNVGEPLDVVAIGSDPGFTPLRDDVFICP
jgi:hypothetical protein